SCVVPPQLVYSLPTRRSSDLAEPAAAAINPNLLEKPPLAAIVYFLFKRRKNKKKLITFAQSIQVLKIWRILAINIKMSRQPYFLFHCPIQLWHILQFLAVALPHAK